MTECFSSKIMKKERMLNSATYFHQSIDVLARAIRQKRKEKKKYPNLKGRSKIISTYHFMMILYM